MKPPRLIHISKTGGQAISTVALEQAKLRWGMFDEEYRWETLGNLIQSHKKLCKAFLMLLKERDTDE
jgi:hypothetical protein